MTTETQVKHTPGPWVAVPTKADDKTPAFAIHPPVTHSSKGICFITGHYYARELHANASLIAAAPELLEALQAIYTQYPNDHYIDKVIAKAEGRA